MDKARLIRAVTAQLPVQYHCTPQEMYLILRRANCNGWTVQYGTEYHGRGLVIKTT